MKKLMIALAAAATTVFAFGAGTAAGENRDKLVNDFGGWTGTSFEAFSVGPKTVGDIVNYADDGTAVGDYYWYSTAPASDELGAITNDVASGVSRPDMFAAESSNTNSLQIDTTAPLVRTALPLSSEDGVSPVQPVDIGDGIYLDTLVKFTAADEAFAENLTGGDKIAIEYVEHEAEEGDEGYTNFVVRAGFVGGSEIVQTNYFAAVPAGFNKDEWHRLTVRTIADVGDGNVGFVIYLDGDVNKTLKYSTDVDAGFGTLDDAVAEKFYNSEKHALFPSAVNSGNDKLTISSVAFSGNGFIDDVSFAAEAPNFIKAGEAVVATFVADAGVTAISVSVAGVEDPISVVNGSATLPAQTTAFTVNVTVDEANGYTFGSMTVGDTVYDTNPASVTGYAGGEITVTTVRNNFNVFDENGDPIQGTFQTLTEAFAAEGVAMIKLAYDYDALAFEGDDFDGYDIDGEIVLDLNGNDLDGGDDSAGVSLFRVADTLTIKDSVGGGSITYDTQYGYAIVKNDGSDVIIGAATGDAGATFNGKLFEDGYEGNIVKGSFDDASNAEEGVFLWGTYVVEGSACADEPVAGYWVVAPSGGSTTFALTTTGGENAEIVTDPANVSALTEATDVTITATATNGFTYATVDLSGTDWSYNSNDDAISMTTNISEDTEIAVPDAVAKTVIGSYEVTVIPTNNTTYAVVGAASNEGDVYTVATGHSITITVTPDSNYEYASEPEGWTLGEGVITKEISEAGTVEIPEPTAKQQGGYPSYIDPTDTTAKAKYDEWKATYGADTESAYEDAFLLNCAPAEVATEEAAFKFTAIYQDSEGNWVAEMPEKNTKGSDYNGTVTIKRYSDVGCTVESESGNFFKATLD